MLSSSVSPAVKITFILASLQAAAVCLYGVLIVAFALVRGDGLPVSVLMVGGFFVIVAATIFLAGRLILRGRPSGRSLLLVWQLFILIIGVQTAVEGQPMLGLPCATVAGVTLLMLFSAPLNNHLVEGTPRR